MATSVLMTATCAKLDLGPTNRRLRSWFLPQPLLLDQLLQPALKDSELQFHGPPGTDRTCWVTNQTA
jgi:hypothetical protein